MEKKREERDSEILYMKEKSWKVRKKDKKVEKNEKQKKDKNE